MPFFKRIAPFLLCVAVLGCRETKREMPSAAFPFEEPTTVGTMADEAAVIVLGEVEKVESWKGRKDWSIVTLRPERVLKGSPPPSVKILEIKLFPNTPSLFSPKQKLLVFLRNLPPFTAWQGVLGEGVRYGVLGKDHGVVADPQAQKELTGFLESYFPVSKDPSALKKLFLDLLSKNPSSILNADLAAELFQRKSVFELLTPEDLGRLDQSVRETRFPNQAKLAVVKGMTRLPPEEGNRFLKGFFCLVPAEVCLLAAETLESRGIALPVAEYAQALQKAPTELKVGLLAILGRHRRREALPLFEAALKGESDEKVAQSILEAAGKLGGEKTEALCLRYAQDGGYYVRVGVVRCFGGLKSPKGIPFLEKILQTNDPSMVTLAAEALQAIGTPEALQTLSKYYEKGHHGHWERTGPEHFLPKER